MQKADIAYINNTFYRILKTSDNQTLVIDCLHPKMPFWTLRTQYTPLPEKQLYDALNIAPPAEQELTSDQMRIAHERYTLIAPILYHLGDNTATANIISSISEEHNISKQTIRRYLYQYLIFQTITVLAPKVHTKEKVLTKDEKNMRWALNKFFYTRRQNSLVTAYESYYPIIHPFISSDTFTGRLRSSKLIIFPEMDCQITSVTIVPC